MVSGKQKKQWLQQKRAAEREKQEHGDDKAASLDLTGDAERQQQSAAASSRQGGGGGRGPGRQGGRQAGGGRPRQLTTKLAPEDAERVAKGKADATRPLALSDAVLQQMLPQWPEGVNPPISMPVRPPWSYSDTKQQLEERERRAFDEWCRKLNEEHPPGSLNRFERNLEVWRQLWRTTEVSDVVLCVVDCRTPLLSFPAPLYEFSSAKGVPVIVALNKCDLLPPGLADAWAQHLKERFPKLAAVVPFYADPGAAPKGGLKSKQRRNGYTRWTQGPEEVATSVQRLMAVVKAQPVPRLGAGVVVGDMFGADGAGADGRGRGGGHAGGDEDAEEEEKATHALARSAEWAQAAGADGDEHDLLSSAPHDGTAAAAAAAAATAAPAASPAPRARDYVTIGVVGEPNMGKSALINRLFRAPVVKASPTPGCTKRLQTLFLAPRVRLADCPGLIFPKVGVPLGLQLLCGNYPIAQAREPFGAVRYLAETGVHPPLEVAYGLDRSKCEDSSTTGELDGWSPYALMEALAIKRSYLTKGGRPDVHRAANRVLRDALAGRPVKLCFAPPGHGEVRWGARQAQGRAAVAGGAGMGAVEEEWEEEEEEEESDGEGERRGAEEGSEGEEDEAGEAGEQRAGGGGGRREDANKAAGKKAKSAAAAAAQKNPFDLLGGDDDDDGEGGDEAEEGDDEEDD